MGFHKINPNCNKPKIKIAFVYISQNSYYLGPHKIESWPQYCRLLFVFGVCICFNKYNIIVAGFSVCVCVYLFLFISLCSSIAYSSEDTRGRILLWLPFIIYLLKIEALGATFLSIAPKF